MNKTFILVLALLALLFVGTACATSDTVPPRLPCEFYGAVTINGVPAPIGTVIIAKIGNEGVGLTTTTKIGEYGTGQNLFTQYNFGIGNPTITFFINGVQAQQTAIFNEGDATKLDLTTTGTVTPVPTTVVPTPTTVPQYNTTKVIGKIVKETNSVVITPPTGTVPWDLDMSNPNNNQITVGSVHVVANCDYILYVKGSTGGYLIGEQGTAMVLPTLKNPVLVWDGTAFNRIEKNGSTQLAIYSGHSGTVDVPIKLQQILTPTDANINNPTIVLSYEVTTP